MKKTLITGGSGLVGSAIKEGIKISSKDYNLINFSEVNDCLTKYKPDYIIHTAAKVGGLGGNMNNQGQYFFDNISINTNVIEAARLHKVEKLVAFLSTCVFPDKIEYPLTEDDIHKGPPHYSNYS